MSRRYYFAVGMVLLLFLTGCMQRQIYEAVYSHPEGGTVMWGKTPDELTNSKRLTPTSRQVTGDQWESWCYQVLKDGYQPSEIVCRPDGETKRKVVFKLKPR